jgi:hypothetical protein
MIKTAALILTAFAVTVVALASPCEAIAQEGGAGIVEEIRGNVFWRPDTGAREERLDPRADAARRLYPGEQVRCARGSSLRLWLGLRRRTVYPSAWFTIPRAAPSRSNLARRMLNDYGRVGGLDRGEQSKILAPSENSMVVPGQFSIRWAPSAAGCTLSLTMRDVGRRLLWRQEDVDGASGSLTDDGAWRIFNGGARRVLVRYRDETGRGPLTLQLDDSCGGETRVSFLLLSVKSEQSLERELSSWGREAGTLLQHLGRASVYSRYGVFPQAADEYESALREAPGSRHLLIRTIKAHRQAGNFLRARELERRLPDGTNIP